LEYLINNPLEVPDSDEGFLDILKQRFGFNEFKEGQLESIKKVLVEKVSEKL
jgi:hypothetical protein